MMIELKLDLNMDTQRLVLLLLLLVGIPRANPRSTFITLDNQSHEYYNIHPREKDSSHKTTHARVHLVYMDLFIECTRALQHIDLPLACLFAFLPSFIA